MKPDYLDVVLFGAVGVAFLGAFYRMTRGIKAPRVEPVKANRQKNPVVIRRPRNW